MSTKAPASDDLLPPVLRLATSLAWAKGAYTVSIAFGSGRQAANLLLDTGSSFLVLEACVHAALMVDLAAIDPRLPQLGQVFWKGFNENQQGIANEQVDALDWPDLTFHLQADGGGEVALVCPPEHYWPRNAMVTGQSFFLLMPQLAGWPNQSIPGLPLLAGRYCVFDRSAGDGLGRVRVAPAHPLSDMDRP